jgi:hypothetical protein
VDDQAAYIPKEVDVASVRGGISIFEADSTNETLVEAPTKIAPH